MRSFLLAVLTSVFVLSCSSPVVDEAAIKAYGNAREAYISGDFPGVEKFLSDYRDNQALSPQVPYLLAKTAFMKEDFQQSQFLLTQVLDDHPAHSDARLWLARTRLAQGEAEQAELILKEALAWSGEDPRVLALMGTCQEILGKTDTALDYYRKAALFESDMVKLFLSLANIYGKNRQEESKSFYIYKAAALASKEGLFSEAISAAQKKVSQ